MVMSEARYGETLRGSSWLVKLPAGHARFSWNVPSLAWAVSCQAGHTRVVTYCVRTDGRQNLLLSRALARVPLFIIGRSAILSAA